MVPCPSPALSASLWVQQSWVSSGHGPPRVQEPACISGGDDGALGQVARRLLPSQPLDCGGFLLLGRGLEVGSHPLSAVDHLRLRNLRQTNPRKGEKENLFAH